MAHQLSKASDISQEWPEDPKNASKSAPRSDPSTEDHSLDIEEWDTISCLFCNVGSDDFDSNLAHMMEAHNLNIPEEERLIVDLETLLSYCHLVIFGYLECPTCGTQRATVKPLQAHMRDKKHCGIRIEDEEADFRVFYDLEEEEDVSTGDEDDKLVQVDKGQVRLPSGKILANKTYRAPRPAKPVASPEMLHDTLNPSGAPQPSTATSIPTSSTSTDPGVPPTTALSRADKRNLAATNQLSHLRTADRMQLAHLPASEQRAILATQKKQAEKERRAQQWMRTRLEKKGNQFLMARFSADVKLGKGIIL